MSAAYTISRRRFLKASAMSLGAIAVGGHAAFAGQQSGAHVLFTKDLSASGLLNIYSSLMQQRRLPEKVAVKLHSGEPGGHNYPAPELIRDLVRFVDGTIVECNTAYPGRRFTTEAHKVALEDHGFTAIAGVDVMDEEGSIALKCPASSRHITENFVGSHFTNYDSFVVLSHFKGHAMAGFGGAIKNMSIGIASGEGKMWIHTAGVSRSRDEFRLCFETEQNLFLESMAEAAGSVMNALGDNIVYVSLMNNLSVDCDCDSHPAPPELDDIGILASIDPVALDKACLDLVYGADESKSKSLRERIESRNGMHTLQHAEALGLGSQSYDLITIDA